MIFNELTEDNFLLFAIKNYENPQAVTKEDFDRDLNHFKYIKRLLKRYKRDGELKTHLLLNHFIILYNIFTMKTFVMFLGKLPEYPRSKIHDVQVDLNCLSELYKIYKKDGKKGSR